MNIRTSTQPPPPELLIQSEIGDAELLVVATTGEADALTVAAVGLTTDQISGLTAAARSLGATAGHDDVVRLPAGLHGLPALLLVSLNERGRGTELLRGADLRAEVLRQAAGVALRAARTERISVALPHDSTDELAAIALGASLGSYRPRLDGKSYPRTVHLITELEDPSSLQTTVTLARAIHLTRLLVDCPPGDMPPARLADRAVEALQDLPVSVEVLDEHELAEQGYGGILAVGQGSANPPRLVRMAYDPSPPAGDAPGSEPGPAADQPTPGTGSPVRAAQQAQPVRAAQHLVLIGKGITFDSGGLSLKPASAMPAMKSDMAGAAAVLGALAVIASLELPIRVTGYLAVAENMPSGSAQRPGDVIRSFGGKTVEVLNTDAEGRLVLMDALGRCAADAPDAIIDIATLTGAQVVALGQRIAGVMGNDDAWRDEIVAAANASGELAWPMPIPAELRPSLDSTVADIANIGERNGGMMTAAAFLRDFVPEGVRWGHMDIAGPAFVTGDPWGYNHKGATGYGVRTLVEVARRMSQQESVASR